MVHDSFLRSATWNLIAHFIACFVAVFATVISPSAFTQDNTVTVFAAASLKNAVDEISAAFTKNTGVKVVASYAASPTLIKQIEQGAPADVFASANIDWMDYGSDKKVIKDETRINLLGNQLVLIAPKDSTLDNIMIGPDFNLARLVGGGRIVTADVRAVPVGKYAKAALEKLGSWNAVASKFAMTENVRAALMLVARGGAPLGIVYATDAKVEPRVKVIGLFPADSHPAIVYPRCCNRDSKTRSVQLLVVFALRGCEGGVRALRLPLSYPARFLIGSSLILS